VRVGLSHDPLRLSLCSGDLWFIANCAPFGAHPPFIVYPTKQTNTHLDKDFYQLKLINCIVLFKKQNNHQSLFHTLYCLINSDAITFISTIPLVFTKTFTSHGVHW